MTRNNQNFIPYWCNQCKDEIDIPYIETIVSGECYCDDCGSRLTIILPDRTNFEKIANHIDGYDRDDPIWDEIHPDDLEFYEDALGG